MLIPFDPYVLIFPVVLLVYLFGFGDVIISLLKTLLIAVKGLVSLLSYQG